MQEFAISPPLAFARVGEAFARHILFIVNHMVNNILILSNIIVLMILTSKSWLYSQSSPRSQELLMYFKQYFGFFFLVFCCTFSFSSFNVAVVVAFSVGLTRFSLGSSTTSSFPASAHLPTFVISICTNTLCISKVSDDILMYFSLDYGGRWPFLTTFFAPFRNFLGGIPNKNIELLAFHFNFFKT
jgi:hypothetical protein